MSALGVALALLLSADGKDARPKVAVTEVVDVTGQDAAKARLLTQVVVSEVSGLNRFSVIDSAGIAQVIGLERQKKLLGCADSGCLAEIGGALGANYLLTGTLGRLGKQYRIDLKLLDALKGTTLASVGQFIDSGDEALGTTAAQMVRALFVQASLLHPTDVAQSNTGTNSGNTTGSNLAITNTTGTTTEEPSKMPAYLLMGGGLLALAASGVFAVVASNDYSQLQKLSTSGNQTSFSNQQTQVRQDDVIADCLLAAGLVSSAVGVYFFVTTPGAMPAAAPAEPGKSAGGGSGFGINVGGHF
jgi:TolB-like protein